MNATIGSQTEPSVSVFEIEAGSSREFFEHLEAREHTMPARDNPPRTLVRRALYEAPLQHRTRTGPGFPERVRRYLEVSFCYG